jgi:hypothetical protein
VKRLDEDRFAIKVTPRKPGSKWSDMHRERWLELNSAGLLKPAGLAAAPTANKYAAKPRIPELPAYIAKAIKLIQKRGASFKSSRGPSAATLSSGSTSQNVRRLGSGAFANRQRCSRRARSLV